MEEITPFFSYEALEQVSGGLGPVSGAFVLACGVIVFFGGPPLVDYLTGGRW